MGCDWLSPASKPAKAFWPPACNPDTRFRCSMWSIWMFTIPSLRAKECTANEKDALNILFLLVSPVAVAHVSAEPGIRLHRLVNLPTKYTDH